MNTRLRWMALGLALALALAGQGCHRDEANEPGIAATVNGAPITVAALEARHDLTRLAVPLVDNPAVDQLRSEYGAVLASMIVARLADQELARHRLAVTGPELDAAETAIRADYPDDTFAAMLLEEHIDRARWREALRDRLTLEKFAREILRPGVRVGVTEAADYYKEHIDAFTQPARTRFLLVRATEAATARAALAAYRKDPSRTTLESQSGVTVQEVTVADRNLTKPWREALRGLKVGDASPVLADGTGGTLLVLLEHQGENVLEPATAYARVEAILSARKLEEAMESWLTETLAKARIKVSPLLLAQAAEKNQAPVQPPAETDPASSENTSLPPVPAAQTPALSEFPAASAPAPAAPEPSQTSAAAAAVPEAPTQPEPATEQPVATSASPPAPANTAASESAPPAEGPGVTEPAPVANPPAALESSSASEPAVTSPPAPVPEADKPAAQEPGSVEFTAVKASWILFTVDDKPEERTYLKPGKPFTLTYSHRLVVRLGSPCEVSYKAGARQETVAVGKKESRVLEFP
ncbi:MAG: peptidyl-prolyl cis-trans isomerase [Desulfovibrionaceae bacterium]